MSDEWWLEWLSSDNNIVADAKYNDIDDSY